MIIATLRALTISAFSYNPFMDNSVAQCIASNCAFPPILRNQFSPLNESPNPGTSLTSLRISGCIRITDDGLIPITRACSFLRIADFSGLKAISDVPLHDFALRTHRVWALGWDNGLSTCEEKSVQNYRLLLPHTVSKLVASGVTIPDAGDMPATGDAPGAGAAASDASAVAAVPRAVAFGDDGEVAVDAEKKANLCAAPAPTAPPSTHTPNTHLQTHKGVLCFNATLQARDT